MRKFKCKNCGALSMYSEKWDCYFCNECNIWLEDKCNDPDCEYCVGRPPKPEMNMLEWNLYFRDILWELAEKIGTNYGRRIRLRRT